MVREAYGMAGGDVRLGAEILCRAAAVKDSVHGNYFAERIVIDISGAGS